jgi:hypothetical protein
MKLSALLACLFAVCASPLAFAQNDVVFSETFESGFPAGWTASSTPGVSWHVAPAGECGAVTSMMAFNRGPAACDYAGGGQQAGTLHLPNVSVSGIQPPFRLSFDYILQFDVTGDSVALLANDTSGVAQLFATTSSLVNDGALHSIVLDIPALVFQPPAHFELFIDLETDGIGDQGRGFLIDNVRVIGRNPGAVLCNGQVGSQCPCGNGGGPFLGCANSTGVGAGLSASGYANLTTDLLQLQADHLPFVSPALFFEGTAQISSLFGNGRQCVGGTIARLGTRASPTGTVIFPGVGQPSLSSITHPPIGSTRYYQVMYRDAAGLCGQPSNLSNMLAFNWLP